jgi:phage gp46-like protein
MTAIAISPLTGDYTVSNGVAQRDNSGGLMNAIVLRILTPLGSYWAEPLLGSRLHELQREKDVARVAVLAKQYSEQALQGLLDDGRASAINVQTHRNHDGWLRLAIEVTAANGQRLTFNHLVKVGQ